jgi:molybdate transport system regulatory protein
MAGFAGIVRRVYIRIARSVNKNQIKLAARMVKLKLKSSQWIVDEHNNAIIGKGRMEILENIEKTGSINQTAKIMKMSYKAVWGKIKASEKHLKTTIVHTDRKEGSRLSQEGKELLEKYRRLKKECLSADDKLFRRIFE